MDAITLGMFLSSIIHCYYSMKYWRNWWHACISLLLSSSSLHDFINSLEQKAAFLYYPNYQFFGPQFFMSGLKKIGTHQISRHKMNEQKIVILLTTSHWVNSYEIQMVNMKKGWERKLKTSTGWRGYFESFFLVRQQPGFEPGF